jgi:hypothetical protein
VGIGLDPAVQGLFERGRPLPGVLAVIPCFENFEI